MTISRTAEYMTEHPYFREACSALLRGEVKDMKILLIDLMAHVATEQNGLDARTFNKRRRETWPDINRAIREQGCGCELNFKMPITECKIIEMTA